MRTVVVLLLLGQPCLAYAGGQAQPGVLSSLTIQEAVKLAVDNYPAVRAALANIQVSAAGVDLARTIYLPRADVLWQMNRATRNSVVGLVLPQPVVAGISGGIGVDRNETVWGSATGLMINWEPFDFGVREATVESAESSLRRASASADVTQLQVATAAAEAFLNVVATEQLLRAAAAAVERARVFFEVVGARVQAGLRPGVDAERARAELATAETQRIIAEQNALVARVGLAQYTGQRPEDVSVNAGRLLGIPPPVAVGATVPPLPAGQTSANMHPLAAEQNAAIDESRARLRVFERSYLPRFNLLFNTYARGSGVRPDGTLKEGLGGLVPDVSNWAVGLNVIFPLLDRPAIGAREAGERQRQVAETARYARVIEDLEAQMGRAQTLVDGAQRAAANTPFQLAAASSTERQATARYQAGLSGIVEVADAQRLLTQAEIDDAIAKLNVWRGLLLVATAEGNLDPFFQLVQP
jgi:outer membrane protein TolC